MDSQEKINQLENQPGQPLEAQPPILVKKSKKEKILLWLLVGFLQLILLFAAGLTGFFFGFSQVPLTSNQPEPEVAKPTATPSPTVVVDPYEGWLTFVDQKNNFTIRYPLDWFLAENPKGKPQGITIKTQAESDKNTSLVIWIPGDPSFTLPKKSAPVREENTLVIDVSGQEVHAQEIVYQTGEQNLLANLQNGSTQTTFYLEAASDDLAKIGKKIIQSFKFQRVSPFS